MGEKKNKLLDFFGFGSGDDYDEDYFDEETEGYEAPVRGRSSQEEYEKPHRTRKPKVVPVQERNGSGARSSVVIYSPKTYNDAQPLVMQLIQHKHVIIKLDKVDRKVGQRILDFMSGAAYAADAQVTEVSKGSIYLFASNQTFIDKGDEDFASQDGNGFTLEDEF